MSNRKQTSLNFYRTELMALVSTGKTEYKTEPEIYEQAKELHKQEMIDAYEIGFADAWDDAKYDDEPTYAGAEQYYNETYGGQNHE